MPCALPVMVSYSFLLLELRGPPVFLLEGKRDIWKGLSDLFFSSPFTREHVKASKIKSTRLSILYFSLFTANPCLNLSYHIFSPAETYVGIDINFNWIKIWPKLNMQTLLLIKTLNNWSSSRKLSQKETRKLCFKK